MIYIDKQAKTTVCSCERCAEIVETGAADGVVPEDWMTGHLWLDVSLTQQKQFPICFCPNCAPLIGPANFFQISAREL